MSSLSVMTEMLSEAKESIHARHIEQFYIMCQSLILEMVPQLIKNELDNIETDLLVKIQTQINGRDVDFPDVRQYIRDMIENEIKKMIKDIRL